jgi:hypothetical protein
MPLALDPFTLLKWLISPQALMLGKKEADPSIWRILSDLEKGRQKRIHPGTEARIWKLVQDRWPLLNPSLLAELRGQPDCLPWEGAIAVLDLVVRASGGPPWCVLGAEAIRLEQLSIPVEEALERGDFHVARDLMATSNMPQLECLPVIISQIDCSGDKGRFAVTAAPVVIVTTLYLLACVEADSNDKSVALGARLIPEMRDGTLVRPMRRWLEGFKEEYELRTEERLAQFLLTGQDEKTSQREVRKWWSGEIPAWTRVRRMARALSQATGRNDIDPLERMLRVGLAAVRLLDRLLSSSLSIHARHLPYDPYGPFREYPAMLAHARKVKTGLLADANSPASTN